MTKQEEMLKALRERVKAQDEKIKRDYGPKALDWLKRYEEDVDD